MPELAMVWPRSEDISPCGQFMIQTAHIRDDGTHSHLMERVGGSFRDTLRPSTEARFGRAGIDLGRLSDYGPPSKTHTKIRNAVNALYRFEAEHGPA